MSDPATQPTSLADALSDADVRRAMHASIRLLAIFSLAAAALFLWRFNWQSALLVLIGAAISAASLWEWLRLITILNRQMDATPADAKPRVPIGLTIAGFLLRLGLTVAVLYVSLKYLHGTALALAAGLALGLFALTIEALRLMKR